MKSIVELVNAAAEQVGAVAKKERNTHQGFVFRLDDEALQLGYRLVDRALTTWDHCMTLDEWPGMPQTIQIISAPRWAHYTTEEEEY